MYKYANVIITIPKENGFDYAIPPHLEPIVKTGVQVIVPFKHRYVSGIVIRLHSEMPASVEESEIKSIQEVVSDGPMVSEELIHLLKWIADYYICHLGEAYRLIQSSLHIGSSKLYIMKFSQNATGELNSSLRKILEKIPDEKQISLEWLKEKVGRKNLSDDLRKLEKSGFIRKQFSQPAKKKILQTQDYFRLIGTDSQNDDFHEKYQQILNGRQSKSQELIHYLNGKSWTSYTDLNNSGFSRQVVNRLVKRGLLERESRTVPRNFEMPYREIVPEIHLSEEQREFVNTVEKYIQHRQFKVWLLHGITGSGKTQVYIELIQQVVAEGRQAIVLIPEIVLTPQTLARFKHYFGERVGVLHSRFSAGEKREILYNARNGEYDVILGPRSALFSPLQKIGLIVVDEEHESSYKQTDAKPHYHARDVAVYRGKLNNAVVVLGSATPSFESLYNSKKENYGYFKLMKRIEARALPRISVVDLKQEWQKDGGSPVISENLELKIESRLLTKEQVMVLQNRRGYSPYILCKDCGYVAKCKQCEITLTYHQVIKKLICHYCGYQTPAPDVCPSCEGMDILYKGIGTQRLEEVLKDKFPHAITLRMDQDTTKGKHGHLEILEKFRSGQADLLLGTKMIAKGLDFQQVSLVGIASSDQGLHFPDFRAAEKVFQLLTQAAGRAGRGASGGEVVVQTFDPAHYIFKFLLSHDYLGFFSKELESRKLLNYPPFSRLILIKIEGKKLKQVQGYSDVVIKFLWKANKEKQFKILGPSPAPLFKLQGVYRYQILIKQDKEIDPAMNAVRHLLKEGLYKNPEVKKWPVKLIIDVDPIEIL